MYRKMDDLVYDKMNRQDSFRRTITFKVFPVLGTSASKFREK